MPQAGHSMHEWCFTSKGAFRLILRGLWTGFRVPLMSTSADTIYGYYALRQWSSQASRVRTAPAIHVTPRSARVERPVRIAQEGARHDDRVGLPGQRISSACRGVGDHPDGRGRDARLAPDRLGERDLVAGPDRDLRVRDEAAARAVDEVHALRSSRQLRRARSTGGGPIRSRPSPSPRCARRRAARPEKPVARPGRRGREIASGSRASRRIRPNGGSRAATGIRGGDSRARHAPRRRRSPRPTARPAAAMRTRPSRGRCPRASSRAAAGIRRRTGSGCGAERRSTRLRRPERAAALPGHVRRRLPPRVRELDTRHGAARRDETA